MKNIENKRLNVRDGDCEAVVLVLYLAPCAKAGHLAALRCGKT